MEKGVITRRDFLKNMARYGSAFISLPLALKYLGLIDEDAYAELVRRKAIPGKYYRRVSGRMVQCQVCPFYCLLGDRAVGQCRTKKNYNGVLYTHAMDNPCIISVDPVEKLPTAHYLPGHRSLTVAVGGCNLHCLYCQNWRQSQERPERLDTIRFPKERVPGALNQKNIKILTYNYTEPVVFMEYILELAHYSKPRGIRQAVATAGYINKEPLKELISVIESFTITLKAFDDTTYRRMTAATLKPVLDTILAIKESGRWLEVINLIVPTYNDDMKKIREMCKWLLKNVGPDVPLHFARFVPEYKLKNLPQTPLSTLEKAYNIGKEVGLHYVYTTNVSPHPGNYTYCPSCGTALIKRVGLRVIENNLRNGRCSKCGEVIPGVWA